LTNINEGIREELCITKQFLSQISLNISQIYGKNKDEFKDINEEIIINKNLLKNKLYDYIKDKEKCSKNLVKLIELKEEFNFEKIDSS